MDKSTIRADLFESTIENSVLQADLSSLNASVVIHSYLCTNTDLKRFENLKGRNSWIYLCKYTTCLYSNGWIWFNFDCTSLNLFTNLRTTSCSNLLLFFFSHGCIVCQSLPSSFQQLDVLVKRKVKSTIAKKLSSVSVLLDVAVMR